MGRQENEHKWEKTNYLKICGRRSINCQHKPKFEKYAANIVKTVTKDKDETMTTNHEIETVTQTTYLGQQLSFSDRAEKKINSRMKNEFFGG